MIQLDSYRKIILIIVIFFGSISLLAARQHQDYMAYHRAVIGAEQLITQRKYQEALIAFESVFNAYDFIFLRDYKVAAQLALYTGNKGMAFNLIRSGISGGWTLNEIKKNKLLAPLQKDKEWKELSAQYDSLHKQYHNRLNLKLRAEVETMFNKDQKLAMANLFKIGRKAKERFLEKKFIPQSEAQMIRIQEILNEYGYPGEKLIGNWLWMWTIISHHNSISTEYVQHDTLYPSLRPRLLAAIRTGELSPYDFAVIEDWYITVKTDHKQVAYGYLGALTAADLPQANKLRSDIGMRSVETRNLLIDIQEETGMDFYLAGSFWKIGKIGVHDKE